MLLWCKEAKNSRDHLIKHKYINNLDLSQIHIEKTHTITLWKMQTIDVLNRFYLKS